MSADALVVPPQYWCSGIYLLKGRPWRKCPNRVHLRGAVEGREVQRSVAEAELLRERHGAERHHRSGVLLAYSARGVVAAQRVFVRSTCSVEFSGAQGSVSAVSWCLLYLQWCLGALNGA